jgi:hypothetical protein
MTTSRFSLLLTNQTIGQNKFTHLLMNLNIHFHGNFTALLKSQVHPAVKRSCVMVEILMQLSTAVLMAGAYA